MIQPLRTHHRRIFLALVLLIPSVFVAGLMVRPKPAQPTIHTEAVWVAATGQHWKNQLFILKVSSAPTGDKEGQILPTKPGIAPDVLVYFSETEPKDSLPGNAHLLGRWDPKASYRLPSSSSGFLVLYSAAQKSVLDFVALGDKP